MKKRKKNSKPSVGPPPTEAILESISDGVFTVDMDWRITSFNRRRIRRSRPGSCKEVPLSVNTEHRALNCSPDNDHAWRLLGPEIIATRSTMARARAGFMHRRELS